MWLVVSFVAALAVSAVHFWLKDFREHRLDFLALMLWGTFVMALVDRAIAFANEGGDFLELATNGLITNSIVLGIAMIIPLFVIWFAVVSTSLGKKICVE